MAAGSGLRAVSAREPRSPSPLPAEQAAESADQPVARNSQTGSVLVCDDDPAVVDVLATMLETHGYRTRRAHGGSEALQLAREQRPAVIVLPGRTRPRTPAPRRARPEAPRSESAACGPCACIRGPAGTSQPEIRAGAQGLGRYDQERVRHRDVVALIPRRRRVLTPAVVAVAGRPAVPRRQRVVQPDPALRSVRHRTGSAARP